MIAIRKNAGLKLFHIADLCFVLCDIGHGNNNSSFILFTPISISQQHSPDHRGDCEVLSGRLSVPILKQ